MSIDLCAHDLLLRLMVIRDLFNRWKQGDEKAFREIFDTYWHSVFTVLAQLTGSEEDAEELAQDIFCSLWERKDLLLLQGELSHYLHRAAKIKAMQAQQPFVVQTAGESVVQAAA